MRSSWVEFGLSDPQTGKLVADQISQHVPIQALFDPHRGRRGDDLSEVEVSPDLGVADQSPDRLHRQALPHLPILRQGMNVVRV